MPDEANCASTLPQRQTTEPSSDPSVDEASRHPGDPRYLQPHFFRLYSKNISLLSFYSNPAIKPPPRKEIKEIMHEP
ncbi:hypothetical protein [Rhodanobacter hydrolyticus]|uniref:Uncharacterized protein n=1 Tax=Rhodanobacter hydrolyticus TaxID=2250595 RepID=A0ABW8J5Q8_9GAMM